MDTVLYRTAELQTVLGELNAAYNFFPILK